MNPNFMGELAAAYGDRSRFRELVFGTGLHAGQRRYFENAQADVNFCLPGNSWGKTEAILSGVFYDAWYKTGPYSTYGENFEEWFIQEYKALVASYNYSTAKEVFDRFESYRRTRSELDALVQNVKRDDPYRIELSNGSIIDFGSLDGEGRLVEAARRRAIYVDEAGHIPDLSATFDNILFPRTMGVGGRIHLFGTPKAHSDPYLLEVYEKGKDGKDSFYYSHSGSVLENEFWPGAEKERVLRNPRYVTGWIDCPDGGCDDLACEFGEGRHPILTPIGKQVINGEFIILGGLFFNRHHVARIFTDTHEGQFIGENHYEVEPQEGRLYLGGFDLGGNRRPTRRNRRGSDATVGFVLDYTERPWKVVWYEKIPGGDADWEQKYETMKSVFETYSMPYLLIDTTGQVDSVEEALQRRGVDILGVHFGGQGSKKFDMLRNLQLVMELEWEGNKGVLRSPLIKQLKHELDHYVLPDENIVQDHVMCLAMLCHEIAQWELPPAFVGEVF
jgi:hypothetical protein